MCCIILSVPALLCGLPSESRKINTANFVTTLPVITDWLFSCGTNDPSSAVFTSNGANIATTAGGVVPGNLAINAYGAETGNWGVAEVMIWNRILSNQEIGAINAYFAGTHGARSRCGIICEQACMRPVSCARTANESAPSKRFQTALTA